MCVTASRQEINIPAHNNRGIVKMGHPIRRKQREKKKQRQNEKMPGRKNIYNVVDLTPHNAVGKMRCKDFELVLK